MKTEELIGCISFIQQAEQLKDVLRSAYTSSGRQESTAAHTWRLCLMAMVFEQDFKGVDFAKLLKICIIHDLGEAISGDIPAIAQRPNQNKAEQERADLITLMEPLDERRRTEFLALWDEYEQASSPEALMVKGLDKLETIIQHNQGKNPPHIDYAFNLSYGNQYTSKHPLLATLRQLIDEDTRRHAEASS
ncbi:MAG: HD domain-containing protein [Cyanobacteria bacterium P01_G01_bin.38]